MKASKLNYRIIQIPGYYYVEIKHWYGWRPMCIVYFLWFQKSTIKFSTLDAVYNHMALKRRKKFNQKLRRFPIIIES